MLARIALLMLALGARAALASPPVLDIEIAPALVAHLVVPAKWTETPELGTRASDAVTRIGAGARRPVAGAARAWTAADGSATLVVTWVGPTGPETASEATDAALAFVKDFTQRIRRGMFGARAKALSDSSLVHGQNAAVRVEWQLKKQKLRGVSRAQVVALATLGFRAVVAQCAHREGSKAAAACEGAVSSLTLTSSAALLTLVPAAAEPVTPPVDDATHED